MATTGQYNTPPYSEIFINSKDAVDPTTGDPAPGGGSFTVRFNPGLIVRNMWIKEVFIPQSMYAFRAMTVNSTSYPAGFVIRATDGMGSTDYTITIPDGTYSSSNLNTLLQPLMPPNVEINFSSTAGKFTLNSVSGSYYLQVIAENVAQFISLRNMGFFPLSSRSYPWGGFDNDIYPTLPNQNVVEAPYTVSLIGSPVYYLQSAALGSAAASPPITVSTTKQYVYVGPPSGVFPYGYEERPLENILARLPSNAPYEYTTYQDRQVSMATFKINGFVQFDYMDFNILDMWGMPVDMNGQQIAITLVVGARRAPF